jgi:hypothetical protein
MPGRSATRWLLTGGAIGPILIVVVFLTMGWTRPGYDPQRMYLSYLSIGEGGWLGIATTVVSGVLIAGGAVGLRGAMPTGRASSWGPILIGLAGLSLIVTGLLVPDHARGYPPGTPLGPPSDPSLVARLHDVAAGLLFLCLVEAMFVMAHRFAREGGRWSLYSRLSALGTTAFLLASFPQTDVLGALERIAIVIAAGWVTQVMWRFRREVDAVRPGRRCL